jgi:predicted DNA-binding transcriptional regulator AlpA
MTQTIRLLEIPDRLWDKEETAEFLKIATRTLYQLNTNGTGPRYFKVGRECRYDPRDVVDWLESRASRPARAAA